MFRCLLVIFVLFSFLLTPTILRSEDMGEILSAETRTGEISFNGEEDTFSFNAESGQAVVINMCNESGFVNPEISLYAPDGSLLASDDGTLHAEIRNIVLDQSGVCTILAEERNGDATGDYSISLILIPGQTVSPQDPDGGDLIPGGETRTGSINYRADTDAYTFEGESGQTVSISMSTESGFLNPGIYLYDPDGYLETSASGTLHAEISDYQLVQSGTYTIVLRERDGDGTGGYSLSYSKIPGIQYTPSVRVILNQTSFTPGETMILSAQVENGPFARDVEVKTWIELPGGLQMNVLNAHLVFTVPANADILHEIISYTFTGMEPAGMYIVGARLLNVISGREYSVNLDNFTFTP